MRLSRCSIGIKTPSVSCPDTGTFSQATCRSRCLPAAPFHRVMKRSGRKLNPRSIKNLQSTHGSNRYRWKLSAEGSTRRSCASHGISFLLSEIFSQRPARLDSDRLGDSLLRRCFRQNPKILEKTSEKSNTLKNRHTRLRCKLTYVSRGILIHVP